MEFAREGLSNSLVHELTPLLHAHFKEISANQDIPLDPDWDAYQATFNDGRLRVFTIRNPRDGAGRVGALAGYGVFIVRVNPHYKGSLQATQDILFLSKELRGKLTGYRFIQWCDQQLKADGVQVVYHHVKFAHDFGPMLERIGYKPIEKIYGRRLDK